MEDKYAGMDNTQRVTTKLYLELKNRTYLVPHIWHQNQKNRSYLPLPNRTKTLLKKGIWASNGQNRT